MLYFRCPSCKRKLTRGKIVLSRDSMGNVDNKNIRCYDCWLEDSQNHDPDPTPDDHKFLASVGVRW